MGRDVLLDARFGGGGCLMGVHFRQYSYGAGWLRVTEKDVFGTNDLTCCG